MAAVEVPVSSRGHPSWPKATQRQIQETHVGQLSSSGEGSASQDSAPGLVPEETPSAGRAWPTQSLNPGTESPTSSMGFCGFGPWDPGTHVCWDFHVARAKTVKGAFMWGLEQQGAFAGQSPPSLRDNPANELPGPPTHTHTTEHPGESGSAGAQVKTSVQGPFPGSKSTPHLFGVK